MREIPVSRKGKEKRSTLKRQRQGRRDFWYTEAPVDKINSRSAHFTAYWVEGFSSRPYIKVDRKGGSPVEIKSLKYGVNDGAVDYVVYDENYTGQGLEGFTSFDVFRTIEDRDIGPQISEVERLVKNLKLKHGSGD